MNTRNAPISQVEIENDILNLLNELEEETEAFETLSEDAAKKEAHYKAEWAKSYLSAEGSIKQRESWADYQIADIHMAWKIAEALVKSKREKLTSIRTAIDALRTLNANVRTSLA